VSQHSPSSDYAYMVWGPGTHHFQKYKSICYVQNISISDGYLTADNAEYSRAWNLVSIYVKSDSLIRHTSHNSIKIALNDIDIVKVERTNWYRFWAYTAIGILTISILLVLIFPDVNTGNKI
jgi:hypothetical protein